MRQISKHDVNKLCVAKLKGMLPFEVVADGKIIFVACDVNKPTHDVRQPSHDVNKLATMSDKLIPKASHDVNKGMAFWNKAAQECLDRNARAGELLQKVQKLNARSEI